MAGAWALNAAPPVFADTNAPPLTLDQALQSAREQNPDIRAARQAWQVKRSDLRAAGTWANPTFSYVDENFPSGTSGGAAEKIRHYRIEQTLPFPGKLTAESRLKYHEVLIAEAGYRARTLDVLRDVRMRFYQLYLTDRQILLASESLDVLKDALRVAQSRLASNQASASDVFMAETELGKMNNELFQAQQERVLVQIQLNTLLNQAPDAPLGPAQAPELKDLPASLSDLEGLAQRNDPSYRSALHEIDHARAMVARERLNFAPDFGFMYERETTPSGPDGRQIGFSVNLPLWLERPWGKYQSAREHMIEAEAQSQAMRNEVTRGVAMEFVETNTHLHLARNYEDDILPSAFSNVKIAREQYATGQADFVRLLEAFRSWIDAHNGYEEQIYHYGEHWAELERWVGIDLSQANKTPDSSKVMPPEGRP